MKRLACFSVCVFLASVLAASAQAPVITGYTCPIRQGGPVPVATLSVPLGSFVWNQAPPVITSTVNPGKLAIDDPAFPPSPDPASRKGIYTDTPLTGVLALLAIGGVGYTASCTADSSAGSSPLSLPSATFTRIAIVPNTPTGVQIYK